MKPKEAVLTIFPNAKCKRIGSSVFRVYSEGKCIGFGGLPHVAWKSAELNCAHMQPNTAINNDRK
ncbi:hypothetical protein [Undibacterium sp. TJN19]|uniref:hypothetical protein n=1 Tax=Undibacterium sp. TJN19 TaxID=3413055 RepID=UPI003BF11311